MSRTGVARPACPANLRELQRQFATAEACQQYLTASRGPDGFHGPRLWLPARLPHADTPSRAMCPRAGTRSPCRPRRYCTTHATAQKRPAERHPVGGAIGGPRGREPAAVADRHVPWRQPGTASGRVRGSAQSAVNTTRGVSDVVGLRNGTRANALSPDSPRAGRHGPWGLTTTCWDRLKQPEKPELTNTALRLLPRRPALSGARHGVAEGGVRANDTGVLSPLSIRLIMAT